MRDVLRYFEWIDSVIRHSSAIDDAVTYQQLTPLSAIIDGELLFADGSRLEFTETIRHNGRQVGKQRYRYQYIVGSATNFRYDNAPHFPQLANFPHHKHTADGEVEASHEVSLQEVLSEISQRLASL